MADLPAFLGASNVLRAPVADQEDTINFMLESIAPGNSKGAVWMPNTPGLARRFTLPTSPVRGAFEQDGRAFVVAGGTFYEVAADDTYQAYGSVANDANPVTMCSNGSAGNQVGITSGGYGYVFNLNTNVLTQITAAGFPYPCSMMVFVNGFGIALKDATRQFNVSAAEDFTTWDPLDIAERSQGSDNISGIIELHNALWLVGTKTTEVWVPVADTFPFAPLQGVFIEQGCPQGAGYTIMRADNTIFFLSQNDNGAGLWIRMEGYSPKRVSTHAIEDLIQDRADNFSNARGWTYQQDGHLFCCLTLTGVAWMLVYDISTDRWHKRGHWDTVNAMYVPHVAQCHMYAFGAHLVGDRLSGAVYALSSAIGTEDLPDATLALRRQRTFPLPYNNGDWAFLSEIEFVFQAGLGTPTGQASAPTLMFELSRDGGKTFSPIRTAAMGPQGAYTQRARFLRCGRYRDGYGRITMTDGIPGYFVGAQVQLDGGTS